MQPDELAFAGVARQAELVAAGQLSSRELVELYLKRIERLDPQLNAFRVVFAERALAEADQADARRGAGDRRPLLGVPVAIKDDMDVAGELTAWGSAAHGSPDAWPAWPVAPDDAEVVRKLRAAGAVILGKTNVPELTIWPFTESERFGLTRNPWDPGRTPGGSSGGSAAAVAAGLVGAALGSDGGGSIRIPAACCGLFGLKPQRGRVSLMPRTRVWHGMAVDGALTRGVADSALMLDVICGNLPGDADAAPPPPQPFVQSAATPPGPLRIAMSTKVPPGLLARVAAPVRGAVQDTAERLESLGHRVIRRDPEYGLSQLSFLGRWLRGIHDDAGGMEPQEQLEPRTRGMARLGSRISPRRLEQIMAREAQQAVRFGRIFDQHDVLLVPVLAGLPPRVARWRGQGALRTLNGVGAWACFTPIVNHLGLPAAAVPAGFTADGFPLSVQLVGRLNDEATLLSLAAQLEADRGWTERRPALAA